MVFKRRKKLSWGRWIVEGFYPRSGWKRAVSYIGHRVARLPDTPQKIARGVGIGVYVCFTPFFGFHFVAATLLSLLLRGNIFAALLATFFGNPITFPLIATGSLALGNWIIGGELVTQGHGSIFHLFALASGDFWHNFSAIFDARVADWSNLQIFFLDVFLPYLVGGTGPGIVSGLIAYLLAKMTISLYQKRRSVRLLLRWKDRRKKKIKGADDRG